MYSKDNIFHRHSLCIYLEGVLQVGLSYLAYLCAMELQFTLETIADAARQFQEILAAKKVVAFTGEMGAGKTTFIHALCSEWGVTGSMGSPSFSIINQYKFPHGIINHLDLYRLKDEEEALRAGVEDCIYSGDICLVEWPERASKLFPEDTVYVFIETMDEHTRRLSISLSLH